MMNTDTPTDERARAWDAYVNHAPWELIRPTGSYLNSACAEAAATYADALLVERDKRFPDARLAAVEREKPGVPTLNELEDTAYARGVRAERERLQAIFAEGLRCCEGCLNVWAHRLANGEWSELDLRSTPDKGEQP